MLHALPGELIAADLLGRAADRLAKPVKTGDEEYDTIER